MKHEQRAGKGWNPSRVVTLTTDFGLRDPYVGIVKGVLLVHLKDVTVVDLTHSVPPQDVMTAAWYLRHAWRWFPFGTVHMAVVDPGVGSSRRILVAEENGHAFLAPDNGLLSGVLSDAAHVWALDQERFALPEASATFHARDVFAPAAAALAKGLAPSAAGLPVADWERHPVGPQVSQEGQALVSEVCLVDHFGNLISGLSPARETSLAGWVVEIAGREIPIVRTYSEVAPGELLALVDSFGQVEVAVRDGDAARLLGVGKGTTIRMQRKPR